MPLLRYATIATGVAVIGTAIWGGLYAYDKGFTKKWRRFIRAELEKNGIEAEIGKLTLDPFQGLVARDVEIFLDDRREQTLARVSELSLDIDFAKLVRREDFLDSAEVRSAELHLPLDPDDPGAGELDLEDVSGKILVHGDTVVITTLTGVLQGVAFKIHGEVLNRPPPDTGGGAAAAPPGTAPREPPAGEDDATPRAGFLQHLTLLHAHRGAVTAAIDLLEEFQFDGEHPPALDLSVQGDLGDISDSRLRLEIDCGPFGFRTFGATGLTATVDYAAGKAELRQLQLSDRHGQLTGFASYTAGSERAAFSLESSIDVLSLISAIKRHPALGEVVFYDPPNLAVDGSYIVAPASPDAVPDGALPVEAIGRFDCGRMLSRGVILAGAAFDFSYRPGRYYLRNGLIEHQSGTATFHAMSTPEDKFRWRGRIGCDPRVFLPFARREGTRRLLNRLGIGDDTFVRIDARGTGPDHRMSTWTIEADLEMRDFTFNGVHVSKLESGFHSANRVHRYTDFHLTRPDGVVSGSLATNDLDAKVIEIESATSSAEPAMVASYFSGELARILRSYDFSNPPRTTLSGRIDTSNPEPGSPNTTDADVDFVTPDGTELTYPVLGQPLTFTAPRGRLRVLGRDVGMNLAATLAGGATLHGTSFDDGADVRISGWYLRGRASPIDVTADITSLGRASVRFLGRDVPLGGAKTQAKLRGSTLELDSTADIFGGRSALRLQFNGLGSGQTTYEGRFELAGSSLGQAAAVLAPSTKSGGTAGGTFSFTGKGGDRRSLTGAGTVTIADGNLFAIPIFGPLSPLVRLALPSTGAGYSVAREASARFSAKGGVVTLQEFEALTSAFRLDASGEIDYIADDVDLRARLNVRGAAGLLLLPVSKLLEFEASGPVRNPDWRSTTLGGITDGIGGLIPIPLPGSGDRDRDRAPDPESAAPHQPPNGTSRPPRRNPPNR